MTHPKAFKVCLEFFGEKRIGAAVGDVEVIGKEYDFNLCDGKKRGL